MLHSGIRGRYWKWHMVAGGMYHGRTWKGERSPGCYVCNHFFFTQVPIKS